MKEAEEKSAEKEVVEEKAKPEIPKPQASSKQFAGKFFSSSGESAKGASLAAGIALAVSFFVGMIHPAAHPVRTAVGGTAAQVTATVENGWKGFVANIPESERKIAEHAYEEAHEAGLLDALVLLFTSIFAVTLVSKIPGGSPVLGFLLGGAAVGPYMLGFVDHVAQAKVLAEFGVVFLLFNIGLDERADNCGHGARVGTRQQGHEHEHEHDGEILEEENGEGSATMARAGLTAVLEHLECDGGGGERETHADYHRLGDGQAAHDGSDGDAHGGEQHLHLPLMQ